MKVKKNPNMLVLAYQKCHQMTPKPSCQNAATWHQVSQDPTSCRIHLGGNISRKNKQTNKQKARAADKQRYSRKTDGQLGVWRRDEKTHQSQSDQWLQQHLRMWVWEVEQQCTLSSIKVWQEKVGEVHKTKWSWIRIQKQSELHTGLTVPLRARCIGFMSGETLIRPELPA